MPVCWRLTHRISGSWEGTSLQAGMGLPALCIGHSWVMRNTRFLRCPEMHNFTSFTSFQWPYGAMHGHPGESLLVMLEK